MITAWIPCMSFGQLFDIRSRSNLGGTFSVALLSAHGASLNVGAQDQ